MKDTLKWLSPGKYTTNETSFTGRPAGYGNNNGYDNYFGTRAVYWSSTLADSSLVWCRVLKNNSDSLLRKTEHLHYAFSVRCLKN
jgi:uncharacterized protein (TIGR02145 family)